jgi:hypothetical protein
MALIDNCNAAQKRDQQVEWPRHQQKANKLQSKPPQCDSGEYPRQYVTQAGMAFQHCLAWPAD